MISIIVTIYNSEKYLKACLDSIKEQTYYNYEVLMINDGSTDSSRAIAASYTIDNRFILIDSEHVGFPQAKNIGLANATGDYIIFLDSDDTAHPQWLEFLLKVVEDNNADIAYCDYTRFSDGDLVNNDLFYFSTLRVKDMSSQKMCPLFYDNCLNYMWNKLIKKELYEGIVHPNVIALSDAQVMYKIFDKANRVFQLGAPLVNYRKNDNSISTTTHDKEGYWEYRLDLFLNIFTFICNKYEISKFICKRALEKELNRIKREKGKTYYNKIYQDNKERIESILGNNYNCNFDIDLVVPFVDCRDKVWQEAYKTITGRDNNDSARFDHPDMFKYFLEGVDKFMPWIRKIHLIVSNIEQVPDYINKEKTHIVLHKDIMPEEILPTFNSSTIEMFISKIEGLSEHFIYSNDDMYPIAPLSKADFFSEDGKPKIIFKINYVKDDMTFFNKLCLNVHNHTSEVMKVSYNNKTFLRPEHSMSSFILSHCKDCLNKMWDFVKEDLGRFRTEKQHTQYMYALYEKFTNYYVFDGPSLSYHALNGNYDQIMSTLERRSAKILCLNGTSDKTTDQENLKNIKKALEDNLKI